MLLNQKDWYLYVRDRCTDSRMRGVYGRTLPYGEFSFDGLTSYRLFRISSMITNEMCWGRTYPIGRMWKIRRKIGKFFFILGCYFWNKEFYRSEMW